MKVLITGFEPFGKETTNPSYEAVRLLPDEINGAKIVKAEIPVVFRKGGEEVQKLVRQENPDIVILVGQSGGRSAVTVERIAINCEDCPSGFPDNAGNSPQGEKIYEDGADGYFSNLPIKAMVKKMMDNDVPASVSNTAGTYVCNDLMYHLLYLIHQGVEPSLSFTIMESVRKGKGLKPEWISHEGRGRGGLVHRVL